VTKPFCGIWFISFFANNAAQLLNGRTRDQGCQIFLGKNISKQGEVCQLITKYTKIALKYTTLPLNIPNDRKI
jgi:hypothetical protein